MQWKTILIILAIFLLGFTTGILSTGYFTKSRFEKERKKPKHERFMKHVGDELGLSKAQKKAIRPIIRKHMESREEARKAFRKDDIAHVKQVPGLIKNNLDDSQYQKLQEIIEDLSKRRGKHGPPPPSGKK